VSKTSVRVSASDCVIECVTLPLTCVPSVETDRSSRPRSSTRPAGRCRVFTLCLPLCSASPSVLPLLDPLRRRHAQAGFAHETGLRPYFSHALTSTHRYPRPRSTTDHGSTGTGTGNWYWWYWSGGTAAGAALGLGTGTGHRVGVTVKTCLSSIIWIGAWLSPGRQRARSALRLRAVRGDTGVAATGRQIFDQYRPSSDHSSP
jgi:hypothetical protein